MLLSTALKTKGTGGLVALERNRVRALHFTKSRLDIPDRAEKAFILPVDGVISMFDEILHNLINPPPKVSVFFPNFLTARKKQNVPFSH
jgi:hypothetical protein